MANIGTVEGTLRLKDLFTPVLNKSEQALEQHAKRMEDVGRRMTQVGATLTATVTLPIVGIGAAAIKMASDAVESESLFEKSFGGMADAARKWSKETGDALRLNDFELRKQSATLFVMTKNMGLTENAAFDMATSITQLAADMASFRNISTEEAFAKLQSGLTGEAEPLKRIGILVDEATIKTAAYEAGIAELGSELTNVQKVQARYVAIMKQTAQDQGDLAATLESPANRLRALRTQFEKILITIGTALLPAFERLLTMVDALAQKIEVAAGFFSNLPPPMQAVTIALAGIAAAAGPVLVVAGQLTVAWSAFALAFPAQAAKVILAAKGLWAAFLGPAGWIAAGVALLVAWKPTRDLLSDLGSGIISTLVSWFKKASAALAVWWKDTEGFRAVLVELVKLIGRGLVAHLKHLVTGFKIAAEWVANFARGVKILVEDSTLAQVVFDTLKGGLERLGKALKFAVDWWSQLIGKMDIVQKAKFNAEFNKSVNATEDAVDAAAKSADEFQARLDAIVPPGRRAKKAVEGVGNAAKDLEDALGIERLGTQVEVMRTLMREFQLSAEDALIAADLFIDLDTDKLTDDLKRWIVDQVEALRQLQRELDYLQNRPPLTSNEPVPNATLPRPVSGSGRPSLAHIFADMIPDNEIGEKAGVISRAIKALNENFRDFEPSVEGISSTLVNFFSEMGVFSKEQQKNMQNLAQAGRAIGDAWGGENGAAIGAAVGTIAGMMDLGRTGNAMAEGAASGAQVGGAWGAVIGAFVGWAADAMHETEQAFANGATEAGKLAGSVKEGGGQMAVTTKKALDTITTVVNDILFAIDGALGSFETFGIMLRPDSKGIRAWVNGIQKTFGEDLQGALDWIVTEIFKQAEISGATPTIKAALDRFKGSTVEELQKILTDALSIDAMGLPAFANELNSQVKEIKRILEVAVFDLGTGADNVLNGPGGLVGTFQNAYNDLFGLQPDVAEQTRASIKLLQAKIEIERANLLALKARIEGERAGIESHQASARVLLEASRGTVMAGQAAAGALSATGQSIARFSEVSAMAGKIIGVSAVTAANALAAIDQALAALDALDFSDAAIQRAINAARAAANRASGGGGGNGRQETRESFLEDLARLEEQMTGTLPAILDYRDGLAEIAERAEEARRAGAGVAETARYIELASQALQDDFLAPFQALIDAADQDPFGALLDRYRQAIALDQEMRSGEGGGDTFQGDTGGLQIAGMESFFSGVSEEIAGAFGIEIMDAFDAELDRLAGEGDIAGIRDLLAGFVDMDVPPELAYLIEQLLPGAAAAARDTLSEIHDSLLDSLGLPLRSARTQLDDFAEAVRDIRDSRADGPVSSLADAIEHLEEEAELAALATENIFSQLATVLSAAGLGDSDLSAEIQLRMQEAVFHLETARLRMMVETYRGLGLLSEEILGFIDETLTLIADNPPDFSVSQSGGPVGGGGLDIDTSQPFDNYEDLLEQIQDGIDAWLNMDVGPATQGARQLLSDLDDMHDLLEQTLETGSGAAIADYAENLAAINAAFEVAVGAFVDDVLEPFESSGLSDLEREYAGLQEQFWDIAQAFGELNLGAEEMERLAAAQQMALEAFWDRATAGIQDIIDRLTGVESGRAPIDLLAEQQSTVQDLFDRVMSGDLSALEDLDAESEDLLDLIDQIYGSGRAGGILRDQLLAMLQAVAGLDPGEILEPGSPGDPDGPLGSEPGGGGDRPPGDGGVLGGVLDAPYVLQGSDLIAEPFDLASYLSGQYNPEVRPDRAFEDALQKNRTEMQRYDRERERERRRWEAENFAAEMGQRGQLIRVTREVGEKAVNESLRVGV